jgi:hypothetical protein
LDARESSKDAQDPSRKKLAFRLPATFAVSVPDQPYSGPAAAVLLREE